MIRDEIETVKVVMKINVKRRREKIRLQSII